MQTSKKIIALVAAVVVLAAAGGGIWLHHRKTAETESAAAVYVSTVAELNAANPDLTTLCYSGVTEAQETKEIKADTSKTIAETYVKEGDTVKKGTPILMMATGAKAEVVEVGYFGAGQFIPCEELSAGMVGYITASLKNVKDTRVGDTVTNAAHPCAEPLPGYKKVNPMVYCGLYPADGAKYPDLRDALEKLQLNDASLQFEPETSIALGFGFRCGFLGLLHLELSLIHISEPTRP